MKIIDEHGYEIDQVRIADAKGKARSCALVSLSTGRVNEHRDGSKFNRKHEGSEQYAADEQQPVLFEIGQRDQRDQNSGHDVAERKRREQEPRRQHKDDASDCAFDCLRREKQAWINNAFQFHEDASGALHRDIDVRRRQLPASQASLEM